MTGGAHGAAGGRVDVGPGRSGLSDSLGFLTDVLIPRRALFGLSLPQQAAGAG